MSWFLREFQFIFKDFKTSLDQVGDEAETALDSVIPKVADAAEATWNQVADVAKDAWVQAEPLVDEVRDEVAAFAQQTKDTFDFDAVGAAVQSTVEEGAAIVKDAASAAMQEIETSDAFDAAVEFLDDAVAALGILIPDQVPDQTQVPPDSLL